MKKKLMILAAGMMLAGMTTVTSFATSEDQTSEASIIFQANTNPTDPKDPTNPDNPGDPEGGTGMDGPLSIDHVPELTFGTRTISGGIDVFKATNLIPYIQVSDSRGTGAGWKVSAKIGEFTAANTEGVGAGTSFPGIVTFANPDVKTTSGNSSTRPVAVDPISLESGEAELKVIGTPAVTSPAPGMGTWLEIWKEETSTSENANVTLKLNTGNVYTTTYKADITWILSDAP